MATSFYCKLVPSVCFALLQAAFAQTQGWTWQNPLPHSASVFNIRAIPDKPDAASAVGASGTIIRTDNAGQTWTLLQSGIRDGLNSQFWLDAATAVVVGEGNTILLTRDGGLTWDRRYGSSGGPDSLRDVSFSDVKNGLAVGDAGTILRTGDGGLTWAPMPNPYSGDEDTEYGGVFVRGQGQWIAIVGLHAEPGKLANGVALYSQDSGATWNVRSYADTPGFERVHFIDSKNGFAVARFAKIYQTSDGGQKWSLIYTGGASSSLIDVYFSDKHHGWAAGFAVTGKGVVPLLLSTDNGGATWQSRNVAGNDLLQGVLFTGDQTGWVVGSQGSILYTKNQGEDWTQQRQGPLAALRGAAFADSHTGWAAGKGILHTSNAGKTWEQLSSKHFADVCFRDIAAIRSSSAVAIGFRRENDPRACDLVYYFDPDDRGVILLTRDGGQTWLPPATGIDQKVLRQVQFRDADNGWIVGGDFPDEPGFALRTEDGGNNWEEVPIDAGSTLPLNSVFFVSDQIGWITGDGGIYKTTNGGATWALQNSSRAGSSFFLDERVGWAVGASRTLLSTEDGGSNWISRPLRSDDGFSPDLNRLAFVSETDGMAVGSGGNLSRDDGTIHRTQDGGKTWRRQVRNQGSDAYFGLARIDTHTAWAVGYDGTILHTTSGGE